MNPTKKVLRLTFSLGLLVALLVGFWQRQAIYDWWRLRGYNPPAPIAKLADETTMNDSTRRVFYVNHPSLDNKTSFNQDCGTNTQEQTIVLGCYIKNSGIYLLDVTDPRLSGVEEVTAAHELLHAEYDRLSSSERKRVDGLINQAYKSITNPRVRETIDQYKQAGADITNELHSILGTEVGKLPPELESYYKQYFSDRLKIVGYSEDYQKAFTARKDQVDAYDTQLSKLKKQIDADKADLNQKAASLASLRQTMERQKANGQIAAYNANVNSYNSRVRDYNSEVDTTKQLVSKFNAVLEKRNALALEEQELYQVLDSTFTAVPSQ